MSSDQEKQALLAIIGDAEYVKMPSSLSISLFGIRTDNGGVWISRDIFVRIATDPAIDPNMSRPDFDPDVRVGLLDHLLWPLQEKIPDENGFVWFSQREAEALQLDIDRMGRDYSEHEPMYSTFASTANPALAELRRGVETGDPAVRNRALKFLGITKLLSFDSLG